MIWWLFETFWILISACSVWFELVYQYGRTEQKNCLFTFIQLSKTDQYLLYKMSIYLSFGLLIMKVLFIPSSGNRYNVYLGIHFVCGFIHSLWFTAFMRALVPDSPSYLSPLVPIICLLLHLSLCPLTNHLWLWVHLFAGDLHHHGNHKCSAMFHAKSLLDNLLKLFTIAFSTTSGKYFSMFPLFMNEFKKCLKLLHLVVSSTKDACNGGEWKSW